jgi:hypothetical protein
MSKPLEHDIVRPWLCCKPCRNEYERKRRKANGITTPQSRLQDGSERVRRHDDRIDTLLEILHGA